MKTLKNVSLPLLNFTWRLSKTLVPRTNKTFEMAYVSVLFIEKELRSLQHRKATGIDELPSGLLKDCAKNISKPLCHIINLSISTSTVPNVWKIAIIIPAYKCGDKSKPENFRPISVLPILLKVLEKAIHNKLMDFLEKENILRDSQYGFRNKCSTKLASTLLCDKV